MRQTFAAAIPSGTAKAFELGCAWHFAPCELTLQFFETIRLCTLVRDNSCKVDVCHNRLMHLGDGTWIRNTMRRPVNRTRN
ncbi:hypothetical protein Ga0100231_000035 [Opitutaceae bacterium TAV4]|nr:hypothetical protein Ga0100231_024875 [Opitutaceae bacterium TAV4]RRK01269.1 hypothetical protein Ga0100231_000035 [Opitutaceae bacterium TAV4]